MAQSSPASRPIQRQQHQQESNQSRVLQIHFHNQSQKKRPNNVNGKATARTNTPNQSGSVLQVRTVKRGKGRESAPRAESSIASFRPVFAAVLKLKQPHLGVLSDHFQ